LRKGCSGWVRFPVGKKNLGLPKQKASVKIPDNKAERLNLGIRVTWAWFERVSLCNKQIIII
jgi:hypothetical protein